MSTDPTVQGSDSSPGGGNAFKGLLRAGGFIILVVGAIAIRLARQSAPGAFVIIAAVVLLLLGLGYGVMTLVTDARSDRPNLGAAAIKLVFGLFFAVIALFSVAFVWDDGEIRNLPVGLFRFGYQGGGTAFTSAALLGLGLCGIVSGSMNLLGRRLGWLPSLGLVIATTVVGGLLAPPLSAWNYRQAEVEEWQRASNSTSSSRWGNYAFNVPEPFRRPGWRLGQTSECLREGMAGNTKLLANVLSNLRLSPAEAAVPEWDPALRDVVAWLDRNPSADAAHEVREGLRKALDLNPFPDSVKALKQKLPGATETGRPNSGEVARPTPAPAVNNPTSTPTKVDLSADVVKHLLGKKKDGPELQAFRTKLALGEPKSSQFDDSSYYSWKSHGIDMRFDRDGTVSHIHLYAGQSQSDGYQEYPGELPAKVTFRDSRRVVQEKLGRPENVFAGGVLKLQDEYKSLKLTVVYNSEAADDMNCSIQRVMLINPTAR